MGNFNEVLSELQKAGHAVDILRREYIKKLAAVTDRNVIIYYSGWLQKPQMHGKVHGFDVNDADKNGFMSAIHGMDRSKGLDLVLHTPGGDIAATESLVDYLRAMFSHIRFIVPQLSMSAGTMIAFASDEVVMGKHSSLGPIDPQVGGLPAHGVVEEFRTAIAEVTANPLSAHIWQPIVGKYSPTFVGECQKIIQWADDMTKGWLATGMFKNDPDPQGKAAVVVHEFGDHALTLAHNRHMPLAKVRAAGVVVMALEDDDHLQEAVLTLHHAAILTLMTTPAIKIIENQLDTAHIISAMES